MGILKRLTCRHEWEFVRNIHGDEIMAAGYMRSWWRCPKCGKWKRREGLYLELESEGEVGE